MTYFVMLLLVAVLVGGLARFSGAKHFPGGMAGACTVAFAGAWLGALLLPQWGPQLWQFPLFPSLIGAVLFTVIMMLLAKFTHKTY